MWIFSTLGFFSIVQHKADKAPFLVRAREREDLVNLCRAASIDPRLVQHTPERDYAYRVQIGGGQLPAVFDALEASIDYPNFKDAVKHTEGQDRKVGPYTRVWGIMADVQDTPPYSGKVRSR